MSNTPNKIEKTEEIDLSYIITTVSNWFRNSIKLFFELKNFLIKQKYLFGSLIVLALLYGLYKDYTKTPVFDNTAIVIPNFESVDYLYDKVEALNAKVRGADSLYLMQILDTNYRRFRGVEIEPLEDIYNFVAKSRENIDILRILFQNQDFNEFVDHIATSKNYKYHRMNFKIRGEWHSKEMMDQLFAYLNDNEHLRNYQQIYIENSEFELAQIDKMISQVDSIFATATKITDHNLTGQSVFINDNSQLNNLLVSKMGLLEDRARLKIEMEDHKKIIKAVKIDYNLHREARFDISNKVKYPILIFLMFSFYFFARVVYKKLKLIADSPNQN